MKSILQLFREQLNAEAEASEKTNEVVFRNLRVTYNCPAQYYIEAPESYGESDLQIYIDDKFLMQLPASEENREKFFGSQADKIEDAHFEYDSIDIAMGKNQKADLPWDASYDDNEDKGELQIYMIKNLKYVIEFESFSVEAEDEKEAKEILDTIFNSTESNNENNYDITISLNTDDIEFEI